MITQIGVPHLGSTVKLHHGGTRWETDQWSGTLAEVSERGLNQGFQSLQSGLIAGYPTKGSMDFSLRGGLSTGRVVGTLSEESRESHT